MTRVYTIRSKDRVSGGTSTNFRLNMSPGFGRWNNVKGIRAMGATIPNNMYNIRSGVNNTVSWTRSGSFSITITPGNYTLTQLMDTTVALMTAADANAYGWVIGTNTGTIQLNGSGSFSITWAAGSPYAEMGFALGATNTGTFFTAPNVPYMGGVSSYFVSISQIPGRNSVSSSNLYYHWVIPVSGANFGEEIIARNENIFPSTSIRVNPPASPNILDVTVYVESGEVANLNGAEWEMYIELEEA